MSGLVRRAPALTALVIVVAAGSLLAQPAADRDREPPDIAMPADKRVEITPREMLNRSARLIEEMKDILERVIAIQQGARKHKDVIRLNCVNDRLLQVKKLLNIAEAARNDLIEAVAAESETERYHQYAKITITYEKITVLRDEAEACVGEELVFLGPTEVVVERPAVLDDPTRHDPFDLTGDGIERPAFASPFL